ncbi:MAG: protoheme IX farnesyltransferase [Planctomycetes bacterium]|nr:protoheme IX farnesyltransferase [Planctomycetota bacterium]
MQRWAHRFAIACTGLLLFMIVVGAMVTTTRAGDTNPGWSWRFWEWFSSWWNAHGGRAWEDGHRMIGTVIGFFGIGLALTTWYGSKGKPRRWLGVVALGLICVQGLIGGLRVLVVSDAEVRDAVLAYTGGGYDVELRRAIKAMIHGVTGQVIFSFLACVVVVTSRRWSAAWQAQKSPQAANSRRLALLLVALGVGQLALGTLVRQTGNHVLLHVCGACTVTLVVTVMLIRIFRYHAGFPPLRRVATLVALLLITQVFLGIVPWILTNGHLVSADPGSLVALLRTGHVTVGALLLMCITVQALWLHRLALPGDGERAAVVTAGEFEQGLRTKLHDYTILSKARLSGLVMVTVAAGYFIGAPGMPNVVVLGATLLGVSLVAAGTAALNQYIERENDARMQRTRNRPLPSGRMQPREALAFGLLTIVGGSLIVAFGVNLLAAGLTALTSAIYLLIYTPLKTRTTLNTLVGAIPGALPPMIGWAAARGRIDLPAFVLFAILFTWQLPHFWSIAWLYREDYKRGGMRMLSVEDNDGGMLARQISLWCLALIVTSMLPVLVGMAGRTYAIGALALGFGFLAAGVVNQVKRTRQSTRGVFFASLLYLPLLLGVLLFDVW